MNTDNPALCSMQGDTVIIQFKITNLKAKVSCGQFYYMVQKVQRKRDASMQNFHRFGLVFTPKYRSPSEQNAFN